MSIAKYDFGSIKPWENTEKGFKEREKGKDRFRKIFHYFVKDGQEFILDKRLNRSFLLSEFLRLEKDFYEKYVKDSIDNNFEMIVEVIEEKRGKRLFDSIEGKKTSVVAEKSAAPKGFDRVFSELEAINVLDKVRNFLAKDIKVDFDDAEDITKKIDLMVQSVYVSPEQASKRIYKLIEDIIGKKRGNLEDLPENQRNFFADFFSNYLKHLKLPQDVNILVIEKRFDEWGRQGDRQVGNTLNDFLLNSRRVKDGILEEEESIRITVDSIIDCLGKYYSNNWQFPEVSSFFEYSRKYLDASENPNDVLAHELQPAGVDVGIKAELQENALRLISEAEWVEKCHMIILLTHSSGVDSIMNNYFDLNIPKEKNGLIMQLLASGDPEGFCAHLDHLPVDEIPNREKIFHKILEQRPDLAIQYWPKLVEDDETGLEVFLDAEPLSLLVNFDNLRNKIKNIKKYDLAGKIKEKILETCQPVDILNASYGLKVSGDPEMSAVISDLHCRSLERFTKDSYQALKDSLVEAVEKKEKNKSGYVDLDDLYFNFARKKLKALGLKSCSDDVLFLGGYYDHLEYLTEEKRKIDQRENDDEAEAEEDGSKSRISDFNFWLDSGENSYRTGKLSDDLREVVLADLLNYEDSLIIEEMANLEESLVLEINNPANPRLIELFVKILNKTVEGEQMSYVGTIMSRLKIPFEQKVKFSEALLVDPSFFFRYRFRYGFSDMMTEEQKERAIKLYVFQDPLEVANTFKDFGIKSQRHKYAIIDDLCQKGIAPFSLFEDTNQALSFLESKGIDDIWESDIDDKERSARIKTYWQNKKSVSPQFLAFVGNTQIYNNHEYRLTNMDTESAKAMDIVWRKHKDWVDYLRQFPKFLPFEGYVHHEDWLAISQSLRPDNIPLLGEIIEEMRDFEREYHHNHPGEKIPQNITKKEYEKLNKKMFLDPLLNRPLMVNLCLKANDARYFREVIEVTEKAADKLNKVYKGRSVSLGVKDDLIHPSRLLDLIAENDTNLPIGKLKFIINNSPEIVEFLFKFSEPNIWMNSDTLSWLKKLMRLSVKDLNNFINNVDFNVVSRGFKLKEVSDILFNFIDKKAIDLGKKEHIVIFQEYLREYGLMNTPLVFANYVALKDGQDPSEDLQSLGMTGARGEKRAENKANINIQEFRRVVQKIKDSFILKADFDESNLDINNPLVVEIIKGYTYFEEATWKRGNELQDVIKNFEKYKKEGLIAPVPEGYASAVISVEKSVGDDEEEISVSHPCQEKYRQMTDGLAVAIGIHEQSDGIVEAEKSILDGFLAALGEEVKIRMDNLSDFSEKQEGLAQSKKDIIIANRQKEIDQLTKLSLQADKSPDLLKTFLDYENEHGIKGENKLTTPFIRQLVYLRTLSNDLVKPESASEFAYGEVSYEKVSKFLEFVSNTVKQHVYPVLELDPEQEKKLSKILNTSFLSDEIAEVTRRKSGIFQDILCLPTRGVLAELSGYYSDACWTRQDNIMKDNPTVTGVTFVSNPEDEANRKIAGGCLLIETTIDGEPAIIVRGLNPRENVITKLNTDSFINEYIDKFLVPICQARGIKKIVAAIFNTGALSNRQSTILDNLTAKYKKAPRVQLDKDIEFNGYPIKNKCAVLRSL